MKTYTSHPWLWEVPSEYSIIARERIMRINLENLLRWKRAYYSPDHLQVTDKDEVSDHRFDVYEKGLKGKCPEHPF